MQTHELEPGSPEWHAHRAKHLNASDAPAMLGVSPHKTRNELLHQMKTGISKEFSDYAQERIIDPGHGFEAKARPLAEEKLGEDLYPIVGTNGDLSASFDGINMSETIPWEHKRLNNDLRAVMTERATGADLPIYHQVQCEQQCMVSGAKRVLFTASDWDGDTCLDIRHVWYTSNPELAQRIVAGWTQFMVDLRAYVPPKPKAAPAVGKAVNNLPALVINIKGEVVASNLAPYKDAALAYIAAINVDLKTDQDFANAVNDAAFCQKSEDRLKLVKEQALAQTATIEQLFLTIDTISEEFRQKRLAIDRLVTTRKTEIKQEIASEAQANLDNHVKTLNERLGHEWIPRRVAAFGEAMKGLRTVESLQSACDNLVATEKIALSALADRLALNRKALIDSDQDYLFLFADFATVGTKPTEDFSAIALQRIAVEKARLQKIIDDKKAADEAAQKKLDEAAQAPAPAAPVVTIEPQLAKTAPVHQVFGDGLSVRPVSKVPEGRPPLTSSELNALVGDGFGMTVSFITGTLKIQPVPTPANKRMGSGTYWGAADVPKILAALSQHLTDVERIYCGNAQKAG
jgi:putative phage-type endonuclease